MSGLNVAHNYSHRYNVPVTIEFHWEHDEFYLTHPKDPETIIERTNWIHSCYHRRNQVTIKHVCESDLFDHGNMNPKTDKTRHIYHTDNPDVVNHDLPANDWIFRPNHFNGSTNKVVIWTPSHNSQAPRNWKNFLTNDDWYDIIRILSGQGWNIVELTYRTPIRDAFKQIQEANFVVCYDGMWHYIARNFSKPMFIPSWEKITTYNTPQAKRLKMNIKDYPNDFKSARKEGRRQVKEFFSEDNFNNNLESMRVKSKHYLDMLKSRYHED